jgi:hypothetical protein
MSLAGSLRDMEVTTLIQFICLQKRRLQISLTNGSEYGVIAFDNGDIVHAEVEGIEGEDAIVRLLDWEDGHFSTTDELTVARRTINVPWDRLLMESVVKLDELDNSDFDGESDFDEQVLTQEETAQDETLEDRLMHLLSQLEENQTQIKFGKVKGANAVLDSLIKMANKTLDFFDTVVRNRPNQESLHKERTKNIFRYPIARWLLTPEGRLSNSSAIELYKRSHASQRQQIFADICLSIVGVMDSSLKVLTACFNSKSTATEMSDAYNVFLNDLDSTIGEVKL